MNQTISARRHQMPTHIPSAYRKMTKFMIPETKQTGKDTREPVRISELINPILSICNHPDRNRLLAEYLNK